MKRWYLLTTIALLLSMARCQSEAVSSAAFAPTGEPAFIADFTNLGDECALLSETYGDYYCHDDEFHLISRQQQDIAGFAGCYFNPLQLTELKNFMLEARMHLVSEAGSYGVQFRIPPTGHGSYSLWVRPTGDFQFRVMSPKQDTELLPWTRSAAIYKGTAVNLLQVMAVGAHFTLFANGQQLASVDNDMFATGWPGVFAEDGGHAAVSSFRVWKLP